LSDSARITVMRQRQGRQM